MAAGIIRAMNVEPATSGKIQGSGNRDGNTQAGVGGGNFGAGGEYSGFGAGRFTWSLTWSFTWPFARPPSAQWTGAGKPVRSAVPDIGFAPDRSGAASAASSAQARQRARRFRATPSGRYRARSKDQEHLPGLLGLSVLRGAIDRTSKRRAGSKPALWCGADIRPDWRRPSA
jgi:hypothetical protein